MNITKIAVIAAVAIFLAGLSFFYVSDVKLFGASAKNVVERGFPFHYHESVCLNDSCGKSAAQKFLFFLFLADAIFYSFIVLSFWHLFSLGFKHKKWLLLPVVAASGCVMFWLNLEQGVSCVTGFPVSFRVRCSDVGSVTDSFFWFGAVFNFLFWLSLSAMFFVALRFLSSGRLGKWQYVLAPAMITAISLFYYTPCGGGFCMFSGNGFPLFFYDSGNWVWPFFLIDLLFWGVTYWIYKLIRSAGVKGKL